MKESMSIQKFNKLLKANKVEDTLLATLLKLTKISDHKKLPELQAVDIIGWDWEW